MPDNKINIHGNGNITIQGVNGRDITVNINEIDKFEAIVKQLPDEIVSQLLEKLNLQSGHNFTNAKNIVVGNITAGGNVHVGDVINNPNPKGFCTLTYSLNENDELVRETEFSQLCKLLEKNKIVQIIGKEGLGKTFLLRYAFNQLRKEYEVYGLFIFTENLNFQSTLVNDYRFSINDARFNTMNIEEKASYIITQLNNNSHKKQLLLFQDVSLKAKDLFVLEELINAKIILSTTDSIHEYPAIIELQPFTNEQLKTILGVAVTPEQIALFEQLENNPDCAVIIYRNIDRMDFNSSKNTLQEISTRLSQTQGDVTTIFMDIALDLFDLTPSEVWILLHFSVLPLRQYDRDDIALLLAEVRFACPELDAAIAAFAAECAWWADYIRRIDDENASTEPEFLDMK